MELNFLKKCLSTYKNLISSGTGINDGNYKRGDIAYWRDVLFISLLEYCLPISLFTIIPVIIIGNNAHSTMAVYIHLFVFFALIIVTFARSLQLRWRKLIIVSQCYILCIYHIYRIGYNGPGMFYLLALTVLIALILPIRFAYWSILVSAFIMGLIIIKSYRTPKGAGGVDWGLINHLLAYTLSVVFVQFAIVSLIYKIFDRLQITIYKKDRLRENYMRIFDSSPIPMWLFDIATLQFLAVNDAAVIQYGYSKNEFLELTIQMLRPEKHHEEICDLVSSNKDQITFNKKKVIHLTKDGETLFVNIESRLLTYKGRNAKLVLATNITAQLKAEQDNYKSILKIKQSEANLQAIFNSTSEGFLLLDENYHIISFNHKAGQSIFLNKNSLPFEVGQSIFDYIDESREVELRSKLENADQGSIVEYEHEFEYAGSKLWMHYTVMSVYQDGFRKGICINGRNITDYKTYVHTIESQNAKLRDISWTQSHMVRAPLARIMGLNSLIRTCANGRELEELINYLEQSCIELDVVISKIVIDTESQEEL